MSDITTWADGYGVWHARIPTGRTRTRQPSAPSCVSYARGRNSRPPTP